MGADKLECDLVMKGGIASGIAYPPAVLALHEKYRFRCIGGASAGAIAAAATAAAQHGEDHPTPGAAETGFKRLGKLNEQLGTRGFILGLFQPTDAVRPFFEIALQAEKSMSTRAPGSAPARKDESLPRMLFERRAAIDAALRSASKTLYSAGQSRGGRGGAWLGLVLGGLVLGGALLCSLLGAHSLGVARVALGCAPGLVAALGIFLGCWIVGRRLGASVEVIAGLVKGDVLIDSLFGACTGHSNDPERPALTDWLHASINGLAGKEGRDPLTFGELAGSNEDRKDIELKMVTTDLSYGQPYKLPFDVHDFLFQKKEMDQLFPEDVVAHLMEHAPADPEGKLPFGYHRLPAEGLMPVVVATRMSLSFPLLLCAVPLYRLSNAAEERIRMENKRGRATVDDLERHCFSDGGISSNFPIHFFDRWLPERPTFGIMLTATSDPDALPTLPEAKDHEDARPAWKKIANLGDFLSAIIDTAMSYRDNMQSILPSYRERIVQVPLLDGQGGLNLDMTPEVVEVIKKKGSEAGALLEGFDFDQHRWVRFCVLADHLEQELGPLRHAFQSEPGKSIIDVQLAEHDEAKADALRWYRPQGKEWCDEATKRMNALMTLAAIWEAPPPPASKTVSPDATPTQDDKAHGFFSNKPPVPDSALRITPEL